MSPCLSGGRNNSRRQQDSRWSYLVCASATFCWAVILGIILSFGVLFPVIIKRFDSSRQKAAWIGSLQRGLLFFGSPVAAYLTDKFSCRFVTLFGAVIVAVGFTLTSFAKSIVIYYITFGLVTGFGGSCIRTSSFLVIAKYFHKQKPFATGILSAGAGIGLFVFAPLVQILLDNFSLENTLRLLSAVTFISGIPALVYDQNVEEADSQDTETSELEDTNSVAGGKTKIVDCSVWRVPAFTVFALAVMMLTIGRSVCSIHLVKYSEEEGISSGRSSTLLMFFALAMCIANLAAGRLCNLKWINPRFVFQAGACIAAASVFLFNVAHSYALFVLFSLSSGAGIGICDTAVNLIILTCVDNKRRASAFGLASVLTALAVVSSPPLAGFFADELDSYAPAFYFAGVGLLVSMLLPFILLCTKANIKNEIDQEMISMDSDVETQYVTVL